MQTYQPAQQTVWLPIEKITPRREGAFGREESASLGELAASIRKNGMIQAITVRSMTEDRYAIVSGNRRFLACRMLGMRMIEAVVLPMDETEDVAVRVERLKSGQLHFLDAAHVMRELVSECRMTREALALRMQCSEAAVRNRLKLTALDQAVCRVIREENHARSISTLSALMRGAAAS